VPGLLLALLGEVPGEDRDEGRREGAGDQQVEERVGDLECAMKASSWGVAPKVAPITDSRSQPRTRLAMSAAIITIEARATDIGTDRKYGARDSAIVRGLWQRRRRSAPP
jgi:hypothetical protein